MRTNLVLIFLDDIMTKITMPFSVIVLGTLPIFSFAQIPVVHKQLAPAGWFVLSSAEGDLNKDGKPDIALVIEKQKIDVQILKENGKVLHNNPRKLMVLFNTIQGYKPVAENAMLPPAEQQNSCLMDPLAETEGVVIKKHLLSIEFSYFMSCGGWEWPKHRYTFRWQNKKFELIGFDYSSFHRASGEETHKSYNFSTKKRKEIMGGNMFEDSKTQIKWSNFQSKFNFTLQNINFDDFYTQFNY